MRSFTTCAPALALLAACGAAAPSPTAESTEAAAPIELRASSEPVLAYRHTVRVEGREGGEGWFMDRGGLLFVERHEDGHGVITYEDGGDETRPIPISDESAVDLYFAFLRGPVPEGGVTRARAFDTVAPAPDVPFTLEERVRARWGAPEEQVAEVVFERRGRLEHEAGAAILVSQRGEALFDVAHGRYQEVASQIRASLTMEHAHGIHVSNDAPSLLFTVRLVFDEVASRARRELLEQIEVAEAEGRSEYEDYVAAHPVTEELRAVEEGLLEVPEGGRAASVLELFHARAHASEMAHLLVRMDPGPGRAHLMALLSESPLPDDAVARIAPHVARQRDLAAWVVSLEDARFVPQLSTLARDGEVGERAGRLVAVLSEPVALADVGEASGDPARLLELARRYYVDSDDPRPLIPLVAVALESEELDPLLRVQAVQLLEAITFRALGPDPFTWQHFYERHAHHSYDAWLVEATRQRDRMTRLRAIGALAHRPAEAVRDRLQELVGDPDPSTRYAAAETLARLGERGGVRVLLDFLGDRTPIIRQLALAALGHLAPSTLGFDPQAAPLARARAVGRFQRWASVEAPTA